MINTSGLDLTIFENQKAILLSDYKYFLLTMFEAKNGYPFRWSNPPGRRSHFDIIAEELINVFEGNTLRLIINVPPGFAKSTMLVYFVAWTIARYPDCNTLYISNAFDLAEKHTATIKEIIEMDVFKRYFGVTLSNKSSSKSNFKTDVEGWAPGVTQAFGSYGAVVGMDGGRPHLKRYSGCVLLDDPIKPDDVHSEAVSDKVKRNYVETIRKRARGSNVPIIVIGQRTGEKDPFEFLISGGDGETWRTVILQDLDENDNPLYPEFYGHLTKEEEQNLGDDEKYNLIVERARDKLHNERKYNPFVFWSQHQQKPQPEGGSIFRTDDFVLLDVEPEIIATFITVDTAESTRNWADFSAFSFWGLYKIVVRGISLNLYGIHWLNAKEMRIEPKDLEAEFLDFYASCCQHKVKPSYCYIEKQSTGATLISVLSKVQGISVIKIDHGAHSGNKVARFYAMQPYTRKGQISLPRNGRHTQKCVEHMGKITGNDTHAHDDLADTAEMACKIALIDGLLNPREQSIDINQLAAEHRNQLQLSQKAMGGWDL